MREETEIKEFCERKMNGKDGMADPILMALSAEKCFSGNYSDPGLRINGSQR